METVILALLVVLVVLAVFLCFKTHTENLHFWGGLVVSGLGAKGCFARWKTDGNGGKLMSRKFGEKHFRCYFCKRNKSSKLLPNN